MLAQLSQKYDTTCNNLVDIKVLFIQLYWRDNREKVSEHLTSSDSLSKEYW